MRTTTGGTTPPPKPDQHEEEEAHENLTQGDDSIPEDTQEGETNPRRRLTRGDLIRKSLKITQWNVRSINAQENKLALKHYLANHQPDILVLVETWAKIDINFENDGYLVHQTELAAHQGIAILAKEEFTIKKTLSLGTKLLAAEVSFKGWASPVTVVGTYH
jgi:hypothetical protein